MGSARGGSIQPRDPPGGGRGAGAVRGRSRVASHGEVCQLDGGARDVRTRGCARPRLALSNREEVAREDPSRLTAHRVVARDAPRHALFGLRVVTLAHMRECRVRWDDVSTVDRRGAPEDANRRAAMEIRGEMRRSREARVVRQRPLSVPLEFDLTLALVGQKDAGKGLRVRRGRTRGYRLSPIRFAA